MKSSIGWMIGATLAGAAGLLFLLSGGLSTNNNPSPQTPDGEKIELQFYCAAGIRKPVEEAAKRYEEEYGVRVTLSFAGSGELLSKIRAADSGDLYLAADTAYIEDARRFDLAEEHALVAYQRPVIAVRKDDPKTADVKTLEDLLKNQIRIGLANPEVAAVSRSSRKMLKGSGRWEKLWEAKKVSLDTVNAVANGIVTEAVDAGIVWDATAGQYPDLRAIAVPEFDAKPKHIAVTVLKTSKHPTEALRFLRYLTARDRGLESFRKFGYAAIDGDRWAQTPELNVFAGGLNRLAVEGVFKEFEKREGVRVNATYSGCGVLVGQMRGGARPDLYFACDTTFMEQVDDLFDDSFNVSGTDMVIIVKKDRQAELQITSLEDLKREGLRLGAANPQQSALGHLTRELLQRHELWEAIQPNLRDQPATADILVGQVVAGGLDAAIVYYANAISREESGGNPLEIVKIDDPKAFAVQPIATALESDHKHLAERLMNRIRAETARQVFQEAGFKWLGAPAASRNGE